MLGNSHQEQQQKRERSLTIQVRVRELFPAQPKLTGDLHLLLLYSVLGLVSILGLRARTR